jgi:hypothetical protein
MNLEEIRTELLNLMECKTTIDLIIQLKEKDIEILKLQKQINELFRENPQK